VNPFWQLVEELKEAIIHACGGMTKEEMERRTNKT
jgi:hypothetical protein